MAALGLAEDGYDIVLTYRNSKSVADECAHAIHALGANSDVVRADVDVESDLRGVVAHTTRRFGRIDALINGVGEFEPSRILFRDYPVEKVRGLLMGNLTSPMLLAHLVLPIMGERRWGRIVHFGFGHVGEAPRWPHRAVYAAAKAGLMSFTKSLAAEEIGRGITVNMVCPGDIRGAMKEMRVRDTEHEEDPAHPGVRPGTGEDVARVVRFLCRAESDYLTGALIDVTGGFDPIRALCSRSSGSSCSSR
jgi:3-oxoacyl-[acyl-carrier protein] reductase